MKPNLSDAYRGHYNDNRNKKTKGKYDKLYGAGMFYLQFEEDIIEAYNNTIDRQKKYIIGLMILVWLLCLKIILF